jgi:acyl-CoA reductase-like NAD-dependent aldehyde dehydrogenase
MVMDRQVRSLLSAEAHGAGRALISNPHADLTSETGKTAVGELVGKEGFVEVIKDQGLRHAFYWKSRISKR